MNSYYLLSPYHHATTNSYRKVRAETIQDAARLIAYRYAKYIYGKNALLVDCTELYSTTDHGEFECNVGEYRKKDNEFIGHTWRFEVIIKNKELKN